MNHRWFTHFKFQNFETNCGELGHVLNKTCSKDHGHGRCMEEMLRPVLVIQIVSSLTFIKPACCCKQCDYRKGKQHSSKGSDDEGMCSSMPVLASFTSALRCVALLYCIIWHMSWWIADERITRKADKTGPKDGESPLPIPTMGVRLPDPECLGLLSEIRSRVNLRGLHLQTRFPIHD